MQKSALDYIEEVRNNCSLELLINKRTGSLWVVDRYALKEQGYPDENWVLYEDMSKNDLLILLHRYKLIKEDQDVY